MKILIHSQVDSRSIRDSLGADEYSYYFVRNAFARALRGFAEIVAVQDPASEVDVQYDAALAEGERCLFLSFAPPNKTVLGLRCPTIPVFAWEFGSIPNEVWDEDVRNDWRSVLSVCHGAIALSSFAAGAVRRAMGEHYPVAAIPAPVFDRFAVAPRTSPPGSEPTTIRITGTVLDTNLIAAYRQAAPWPRESIPLLTPGPIPARGLPPPPGLEVRVVRAPPIVEPPPAIAPPAITPPADALTGERAAEPLGEPPGEAPCEPPAEPTSEAPFAAPMVQAPALPDPVALTMAPPPPSLRRRLQIAKHVALEWYRRTLRDRLPAPIRRANASAGRAAYRLYAAFTAAPPALPLPTHRPEAELPTIAEPPVVTSVAPLDVTPVAQLAAPPDAEPHGEPETALEACPEAVPEPGPPLDQEPEHALAAIPPRPVTTCFEISPVPRLVPPEQVTLDGVVYVAMFSPRDGRKNWQDILSAFCWALRDRADATLVLKVVSQGPDPAIIDPMLTWEQNLRDRIMESAPFRCRVVVLDGYLEGPDLQALIASASYGVNASHCEGLCLPMTEFMSGGAPAIAPAHTAFEDYITADNAFVIGSGVEYNVWPADKRELFRTARYRIDWNALMLAFRESYRVAKDDPRRYVAMSHSARDTMQAFCGIDPVTARLREWLDRQGADALERVA